MSWDGYLDTLKGYSDGAAVEVAIWGFESGKEASWATTDGFKGITAEEIKKLANKSERAKFPMAGPTVAGRKCMMLTDKMEDPASYCLNLKTKADSEGSKYSICVGQTKTALLLAMGKKDSNDSGSLCKGVFKTVEYLRGLGY